jgi:ATP-dependent helicase HrpA
VGHSLAQALSSASVEWAVPGLREAQVSELLRALPKAIRRQLMPFPPKVAEIVRDLKPGNRTLLHDLSRFIQQRYGVEVPLASWPADALPQHLRPRVEIVGHDRKPLIAGRDLSQLRIQLERAKVEPVPAGDPPAWTRLVREWERFGLADWTFGDLPERLTAIEDPKAPLHAWPGLEVEDGRVNLRLFRAQAAARAASVGGLQRLIELAVQKDLGWLQKDLRMLSRLEPLHAGLCSGEELQAAAFLNLKRHAVPSQHLPAMTRAAFDAAVAWSRARLPGLAAALLARVEPILKYRQDYLRRFKPASVSAPAPVRARTLTGLDQLGLLPTPAPKPNPVAGELDALVPGDFLAQIPFEQLVQIPRYLKALYTRAERAALNPAKDHERARQLSPYRDALRGFMAAPPTSEAGRRALWEFRWMIEEFKVSLFAQELGTAYPVSPKRLDEQLTRIREG